MIFGQNTDYGRVVDLTDLRDGPDFVSSCLDVEAWEAEEERVKDESLKDEFMSQAPILRSASFGGQATN